MLISTIRRGTPLGAHRLDTARETLVNKIIEQEYLSRSRPTVEEIVRIVEQRCTERRFKPVSRNALRARIHKLDPRTRTRTRYGSKVAHGEHAAAPGSFPVQDVLQSVQIDHALADVIVVDERDRLTIGRPVVNSSDRRILPRRARLLRDAGSAGGHLDRHVPYASMPSKRALACSHAVSVTSSGLCADCRRYCEQIMAEIRITAIDFHCFIAANSNPRHKQRVRRRRVAGASAL